MKNKLLFEKFQQLVAGFKLGEKRSVIPVDDTVHKLGVSPDGYPQFYVQVQQTAATLPSVSREILHVEYNRNCTIVEDDKEILQGYFVILTLQTLDANLQAYFIDIFTMMLLRLPALPTNQQVAVEVEKLICIFSAMKQKPKKMIQGLWGEMLVIERSSNPEVVANAWHSDPLAKYDFTMGQDKVEVKSTTAETRKHVFSLEQLNPSQNSRLLIASIIIRESAECAKGLSVNDLYERICARGISLDAQVHISTVMAEVAGNNFNQLNKLFFDYVQASDSLAYYESYLIPHIDKANVPMGVSEVKFTGDLEGLDDITKSDSYAWSDSELFNAL